MSQISPTLIADASTGSLAELLSDCAGTTLLNQDIDLADYEVHYKRGSVAITGVVKGDELELTFLTVGSGVALAGINSARVSFATCWRIVFDGGPNQPKELTGVTCDEELVVRMNPTEVVPFEDLDLTRS